jgi:hypothetical protein
MRSSLASRDPRLRGDDTAPKEKENGTRIYAGTSGNADFRGSLNGCHGEVSSPRRRGPLDVNEDFMKAPLVNPRSILF